MLASRKLKYNAFRVTVATLILIVIFHLFQYSSTPTSNSSIISAINEKHFEFIDDTIHIKDKTIASNYNELFSRIDVGEFSTFDLPTKCDAFFKSLYLSQPQWNLNPLEGFDFKKQYYKSFEKFKEETMKNNKEGTEYDVDELKADYDNVWHKIILQEQKLHDFLLYLRVYDKCFVQHTYKSALNETDISERMFPWLTFKYPSLEDHTGKKLKIVDDDDQKGLPWLQKFRNNLQGKGIVLTIADGHLDDTVRLLKVLRFLKTELPIQIVYFNNLSDKTKAEIIKIARIGDMKYLGLEKMVDDLPMLDIHFIDVSKSVHEKHLHKFSGFGNKILATFFNTFSEMVLMDADTVPMKPIEEFFEMNKYQTNGTIFFKDRKAVEYRPKSDLVLFRKLLPSKFDNQLFDIPLISNYSLDRDFFKGLNHYMESGMVFIDRNKHFFHPLVMAQMGFAYPINARVYGDKELFWLSFLMLGDENYSFNEHYSAAIGELTPMDERFKDIGKAKNLKSQEVCSNHPAHINDEDDHSLLWFNSGFRFCGQEFNAASEFESKKRYTKFKSLKDFETFFTNKLIIRNAVIPPSGTISVEHTDGESNRAWLNMGQYCNGYTWCAYSSIGDEPELDENLQGITINFTDEEVAWFGELGDVWMSKTSLVQVTTKDVKEKTKFSLSDHNLKELDKESKYYNT